MAEVIDLGALRKPAPNLVSEFGSQAVAMLPPEQKDFDGTLLSAVAGYAFFFQYVSGQLAGALVMTTKDAHELADRVLALPLLPEEEPNVEQDAQDFD